MNNLLTKFNRTFGKFFIEFRTATFSLFFALTITLSFTQAQNLVGLWTFEPGVELVDQMGNFSDLVLQDSGSVANGQLDVGVNAWAKSEGYTGPTITEKTLVSWVILDALSTSTDDPYSGGSALTIDKTDDFDAIVFGENQPRQWTAGSGFFNRTQDLVPGYEETTTGILVKMAITYTDSAGQARMKVYRNGTLIGNYAKGTIISFSGASTIIQFGKRHNITNPSRPWLDAHIEEARIYDGVLTQTQIQNLTLNDASLPVSLSSFSALAGTQSVTLKWATESEVDNVGFEILRANDKDGDYQEISSYRYNTQLKGQYNTSQRTDYQYDDQLVQTGQTYWYKLIDVDIHGVRTEHGPISATLSTNQDFVATSQTPNQYYLSKNFPNPFNPSTSIEFGVPNAKDGKLISVRLAVYDVLGKLVKELVNQPLSSGTYRFQWNGKDALGHQMPSGVYIYQLITPEYQQSEKMLLVK